MAEKTPEQQMASFIAKFTPDMAKLIKASRAAMRKRLPGATEMVYDNFNALVIGWGPSPKVSDAIFSIAAYPKWLNLFFLKGASLGDPHGILRGEGSLVRHIRVDSPKVFADPKVSATIKHALAVAAKPIDPKAKRQLIIKSISQKQRPRRP